MIALRASDTPIRYRDAKLDAALATFKRDVADERELRGQNESHEAWLARMNR